MSVWSVEARVGPSEDWPSARVWLSRRDRELLEPRESDLILELDSRLWGGERDEPAPDRWRPDAWLLDDYTGGDE